MNTELKNALLAAEAKVQYDEKVKRLLGNKIILAHILVKTVDEFQGMRPEEAVPYIEGEPLISVVPVEPGLTNAAGRPSADGLRGGGRIVGMNTENAEIGEGLVRFDIIFYVHMKDGISQVIVNVEAQKDDPGSYDLLNRAVFYVSRMISSQKERDFVNMNYDDIKRVFSIWICMNMKDNCMDYVHLTDDKILGNHPWKGGLNLLNIVLLGIAEELPEHDKEYELHRLLGTLLSKSLTQSEKFGIMETEYRIPVDDRMREDVSEMCNLSQGVQEWGEAIGEARGKEKGEARLILRMYKNGYSAEQIAGATDKTVEEVERIIEKGEPVLA